MNATLANRLWMASPGFVEGGVRIPKRRRTSRIRRDGIVELRGFYAGVLDYETHEVVIHDVGVIPYTHGGGRLRIRAKKIRVVGCLDASGCGYGGGGGGGGGGGVIHVEGLEPSLYRHTSVPGGRGCGDGEAGTPGNVLLGQEYAYNGGEGGRGGGPFGGLGGKGGIGGWILPTPHGVRNFPPGPGENGRPGGYAAPEINGDTSRDIRVWMGSGGGGGGGGGGTAQRKLVTTPTLHLIGGGGGGGGNPGGGAVELIAEETITVKGEILTRGCISTTGDGHGGNDPFSGESPPGRGGSANEVGLSRGRSGGGLGGPGAGGGILLLAPVVEITGTLDTRGGGGYTQNGGTVKIFLANPDAPPNLQTVQAGRLYVGRIEKGWKDVMEMEGA